ncbi:IclR family transcriptional regulator [Natronolimnobius baerhuensis]|uniref:Transcriptional regulator n=1 Tax=Natronolimnobius baerhuensis TaxID=253108 RepID=A0A202E3L6_9EURY|nr:IclR family transcriptional regulator [Natronolimnobius baerhuensis]OVE82842.1 transcriptional regulator [Natronolimnobius baerhuensis]
MNADKPSSRTLSTVSTTFRIIDALERLDEATAVELMSDLDLSKSAVYNHLTTLKQHGYIVQEEDRYSLSLEFLRLGEFVRNKNRVYVTARPRLVELAENTGEYTHLSTEEHGRLIHIWKVKGEHAVGQRFQKNKMQETDRLHYTATGKAILAHLPETRREEIIQQSDLVRKTENTITAPDALREELETIRSEGYAYNNEEQIEGLRAVGAPIRDKSGRVLGAISISGPTSRIKGDEFRKHVPEAITRTANIIEVDLNMDSR